MNVRNLVAFLARVETTKLFRSKTGFYFNKQASLFTFAFFQINTEINLKPHYSPQIICGL